MGKRWNYLVLSELYVPLKGGHIIWSHEVCKRLGNARVITAWAKGLARCERVEGVDIRRINLARLAYVRPESLMLYARLLAESLLVAWRDRPAAILAARVLPEGLIANVVSRAFGVPSVVFAHGEEIMCWGKSVPGDGRRRRTAVMKRAFLWRVYRGARLIVANSDFTRDLLLDGEVDAGRIRVVHPGTDPYRFKPLQKDMELVSQWGLTGKRIVLTVGRLSERKGQDMVLRALPSILKVIPDVIYVIAGTGTYELELRKLAGSLGVDSYVRFLGEVPEMVLPKVYNLADVFIMPNRMLPQSKDVEGFGIVFLEANACGVPVIGGRSGGVPDAIIDGETGFLIDGKSTREITKAVVHVLENPEAASRLGQRGRERVCQELTWDHSANRIKALIERLCKRRLADRG